MRQITCVVCGEGFTAARSDALYCSPACRARARARRRARAQDCPGCGTPFTPARPDQAYCSPTCRDRAARRRRYARTQAARGRAVAARGARGAAPARPATCPACGAPFLASRSTQVYCSPACRARAYRAARSAAAATTPAARACQALAALHAPDLDDTCTECGHPWPCETRRIASSATRKTSTDNGQT